MPGWAWFLVGGGVAAAVITAAIVGWLWMAGVFRSGWGVDG